MTILVNPDVSFTDAELAALDQYMERGGVVLILDEWFNTQSKTSQIIERHGMGRRMLGLKSATLTDAAGRTLGETANPVAIEGGETWLLVNDETPVCAVKAVGQGVLAVLGAGRAFSDVSLGYYKSVPNDEQRRRADLLY